MQGCYVHLLFIFIIYYLLLLFKGFPSRVSPDRGGLQWTEIGTVRKITRVNKMSTMWIPGRMWHIMNNCAKFHLYDVDIPNSSRLIPATGKVELSETASFVYNFCTENQHRRANSVAQLTDFRHCRQLKNQLQLQTDITNIWMQLYLLYVPWCKKVENDQKLKSKGGDRANKL